MSATVTVNVEDALLFAASFAVHVTNVDPSAKALPDDGVQVTATGPLTASLAVGDVNVTTRPAALVASTV